MSPNQRRKSYKRLPVNKPILANCGYVKTGKEQMRIGGESDLRNKALMKRQQTEGDKCVPYYR